MPSSTFYVEDRFISPEKLEELFSYRASTWRRWARLGRVRSLKPFSRVLISLADAKRLLEAERAASPTWTTPHADRGKPIGGVKENSR